MTDDPTLDPPGPDEQRAVLRHIIGYRRLRRTIRASGTGSLGWGLALLALWYLMYNQQPKVAFSVVGLIHLGLAGLELVTGLAKKLVPVPETFLMEAGVFVAFAAANGYRQWLGVQNGGGVKLWGVAFAVYMLYAAVGRVREYAALHRTRFRRPGRAQLRWFEELLAETRAADPEADPNSLDLPTNPPVRAKLLGDTALVLSPGDDDPSVLARDALHVERLPARPGERATAGLLSVGGEDYGEFRLDEYNWKNYAAWKTAGGDPPPPLAGVADR